MSGVGGESGGDMTIFFIHAPFPSLEAFRSLLYKLPNPPPPGRKETLDEMLGANRFCFQTYSYIRHFTSTCVRVCGYETTSRGAMAPSASASRGASAVSRGAGSGVGSTSSSKATLSANGTRSTHGTGLMRGRKSGIEKYVGIDVQRHVAAVTHCPVGVDAERVARDT
ncbi:hypothetical protein EDB19DRAFT_394334 [Suillus lakei]|nr:hypothetical protein EDB19DRAFT_393260 [Suillus lakei]KAG1722675.1 hypothetical protein EDB19DRAFT_394334 [Suillus lakei]